MKIGLNCAGIGQAISPEFVKTSAQAAERAGFSSFWVSEHVVLFGHYVSKYPYDETFSFQDPTIPFMDPLITLAWAAAATHTIKIGTSILILPQRNPVVLAKELATLDHLSMGRLVLGVGSGWSSEEYEAVGVPFERRGARLAEHVEAMQSLWAESSATYSGEFVKFAGAYSYPKPTSARIPVLIGGESDVIIKRAARIADGWMPLGLTPESASGRIALFRRTADEAGRDGSAMKVILTTFLNQVTVDDLYRFRDAGVDEVAVSGNFHLSTDDMSELSDGIEELADRLLAPLQRS